MWSFVRFLILIPLRLSRCIIFGAGNYALLAAKINTRGARQCLIRHYPDASHKLVLGKEFVDCNENMDLTPNFLEMEVSELPEYNPKLERQLERLMEMG